MRQRSHRVALMLRQQSPNLVSLVVLALILFCGKPDALAAVLLLLLVAALQLGLGWLACREAPQSLAIVKNQILALREGDYTVRALQGGSSEEVSEIVLHLNQLSEQLRVETLGLQQTLLLFSRSLAALDGAVFIFEEQGAVQYLNPAACDLMCKPGGELIGLNWHELGLRRYFECPSGDIYPDVLPGRAGRWRVTHVPIRLRSNMSWMLILQPIERMLREQEQQAFEKILRVLTHEINNSIAPIASTADALKSLLCKSGNENQANMRFGLDLISQRAWALKRFIGGYGALANIPDPTARSISIRSICLEVKGLLGPDCITVDDVPDAQIFMDRDSIVQVLINLVKNALEASGETGPVVISWSCAQDRVQLIVIDQGVGLPKSNNLFVPFYTTKPGGRGIGLFFCRYVLERQNASIELRAGPDGIGTIAQVVMPIGQMVPAGDDGDSRRPAID